MYNSHESGTENYYYPDYLNYTDSFHARFKDKLNLIVLWQILTEDDLFKPGRPVQPLL